MVPFAARPRRPLLPIRIGIALLASVALALAHPARSAHAGDPPPPPPPPRTSPAAPPAVAERPAFLAPEPAPGALGRLEGVVELAAVNARLAAVLRDGTMRIGTVDALVTVAPPPPDGNGWLRVAIPARGPAVATTRRGHVHRVAEDGATTLLGRIQRGALPAGSRTGDEVVLATEGGAVFRVTDGPDGARLVETWPSGAEPATAVDCADGRVVVARTTGAIEIGPIAGPAARWLSLASPVTALALGNGWVALGDARGRLCVLSKDGGVPTLEPAPDVEVTALAVLVPAASDGGRSLRIVVLEGSRRLRLHRFTPAGIEGTTGLPLALTPGARAVVAAEDGAAWLVGEDGRVRRVATAPPPASAPAAPTIPNAPR